MCGRYTLTASIKTIAETFGVAPTLETKPRYNVAPTQEVVTIVTNGQSHLEWMQWGLIPSWAKDESIGSKMINARAETLAEKPSFRRLLRSKRCLLVASGFYEWQKENGGKVPFYFTLKNGDPFGFAGLWDTWKGPDGEPLHTCTLITTQPNALVAPVHDRMPVILLPEARKEWLDTDIHDEDMLLHLLTPYPSDAMAVREVSRLVNDPKRDSAELIA